MLRVPIVGMHRSGTSVVARLCNLLGVDLGPEDKMLEPLEENPEGFWENRPLQWVNKELLAHFGGDWQHPPLLPDDWASRAELDPQRQKAAKRLARLVTTSDDRPVGFKDPRTCLTLAFWRSIGAADRIVCVVRDPFEVATSLQVRSQVGLEHALALWNRYTVAALAQAPDAHMIVHRSVFTEPERVVTDLGRFLGLPVDTDVVQRAREAIRPDLYRSRPATAPTTPAGDVARWLYAALAEGGRPHPAVLRALDDAYNGRHLALEGQELEVVTAAAWRELQEADAHWRRTARRRRRKVERLQGQLEAERARANALERDLDDLRRSRTWRAGRVVLAGPTALKRRLRS